MFIVRRVCRLRRTVTVDPSASAQAFLFSRHASAGNDKPPGKNLSRRSDRIAPFRRSCSPHSQRFLCMTNRFCRQAESLYAETADSTRRNRCVRGKGNAMPSMLEQLQAILENAVRRQPAGFADELLPALTVKELAAGFGLTTAELWSVDGTVIESAGSSVAGI